MTILLLNKSFVKEYQRRKKDGSVYTIAAHYNKRVKKNTEHAPAHNHDLSHLSAEEGAQFNQMHAEQHLAKHYDEHALKQQLQDSKGEHDKLVQEADIQEKLGNHKAATKLRNKAIKVNQRMMRFQRQLSKLDETVQGIGQMKDKLVSGSGTLTDDAIAHANYVSKLGAKYKGRIIFPKKVAKPKAAFIPTHTLSDGVPAKHVEDNVYIDKDGNEVQDHYAEPVVADANPNSFVLAPDGSEDFGTIPKLESKFEQGKEYPACPVRMEEGGAFGRAHIQPERLQAFKENGYSSEAEMLDDVAKHFTHIYEQPNGRLLLVKRNGRAKFSVVELQKQGKYYGVTTLFLEDAKSKGKPYETRSGRKLLWPIAEATSSGSDAIFPTDSNQTGEKVADADKSNSNKTIPQSSENATGKQKNPLVMTEEDYLDANGGSALEYGDPALSRKGRNQSAKTWDKIGKGQLKRDDAHFELRNKLRQEYAKKLASGEIRKPNEAEDIARMVRDAHGHEDNDSVQATRRVLEILGYDWKTGEKLSSSTENDSPKEGERNADGLVFRNGRWHRDEEENKPAKVVSIKEVARKPDAAQSAIKENIQDLGEKIGGARKDTATKTGSTSAKKEANNSPAWARRFSISQWVSGETKGKWVVHDNKSKDWTGQARQIGKEFNTEQEAKDALPLMAVALKHTVTTGYKDENGDATYEIWRKINDKKYVKVIDKSFKSREEAVRYMAQHAQEILETNTTFGEADLPVPENKQRAGKAHRDGDVTGESFMHTFGMRGVEFGNWNNQDERQEVMNAAYDGLMDLSEVLGVPPKAIGLNGELALAFGARGAGLSSAKAHYERAKSVINLTKMNGAGSLAHEWLHALDHYLGRQDGKADANWVVGDDGTRSFKVKHAEDDYVSSGFRYSRSGVREELRNAFDLVMETISHKAETYIEDTKKADGFVARGKEALAQSLDGLRKNLSEQKDPKYYKRNNKPASAEQLIEFDTIASQLLNGEGLKTEWQNNQGRSTGRSTNEQLDKISAIYKAVRGRSGFDATNNRGVLDRIRQDMSHYNACLKQLADASSSQEKIKAVPTSFAMDARELDKGRGGNYWTSPHEMAARAFQGYVEDKMAEKEGKNPFLNYAPENAALVTPWGLKRVYPHGQERKVINAAFDKFVSALKTKETDQGTALYSKASVLPDAAKPKGITESQANAAIESFKRDFGNVDGVEFKVYNTLSDAVGEREAKKLGRVKGYYLPRNNKIVIIRDALDNVQDTLTTLRHETLAHYGLNLFTPNEKMAFLRNVIFAGEGGTEVGRLFKQVKLDYPELANDEFKQAEEVFAKICEEHERSGKFKSLFERLLNMIMPILRKVGISSRSVSKAELQGKVYAIAESIRRGDKQQTFPKDNQSQFNKSSVASGHKALPTHAMILLNVRVRRA